MTQQLLLIKKHWGEAFKIAGVVLAVLVTFSTFIWNIGRNELQQIVREFSGVIHIEKALTAQNATLLSGFSSAQAERALLTLNLDTLERKVAKFAPIPKIAEYDERRSKILTLYCEINNTCRLRYRARRTQYGVNCSASKADARVMDTYGDTRSVALQYDTASRVGLNWNVNEFSFKVPSSVALGEAEFFLDMHYRCPASSPIMNKDEESFRLIFTILPSSGDNID